MENEKILEKARTMFSELSAAGKFGKLDFAILRTLLLLAALDGEIAPAEIEFLKQLGKTCRASDEASFAEQWNSALHSAGYLCLMSHFLSGKELVKEFMKESEKEFVCLVALESADVRDCAFTAIEAMASADGHYSAIERDCVAALAQRVIEVRNDAARVGHPHE